MYHILKNIIRKKFIIKKNNINCIKIYILINFAYILLCDVIYNISIIVKYKNIFILYKKLTLLLFWVLK